MSNMNEELKNKGVELEENELKEVDGGIGQAALQLGLAAAFGMQNEVEASRIEVPTTEMGRILTNVETNNRKQR